MDKYDVLASLIIALYDEAQTVRVETVEQTREDFCSLLPKKDGPQIPTKSGNHLKGPFSWNMWKAESIKVGNISVRHTIDDTFIIRTLNHEAKFDGSDKDFKKVWQFAKARYDRREISDDMAEKFAASLENKKLRYVAASGVKHDKNPKNKLEKIIENMIALGVSFNDQRKLRRLMYRRGLQR